MYWIHIIIALLFITSIDGNVLRYRRQQTSGSLYGSTNLGANQPSGFNYPSNTNLYGTNLNNQASKDLYGNSMMPTNNLNNMGLNNPQQQQQQQQLYGTSGQSLLNPTGAFSPSGTNQMNPNMGLRDSNGNLIPGGSPSSSVYSPSNPQLGYPANTNPLLTNKDLYNSPPNSNTNTNNPYGLNNNNNNNNLYPNSNTYPGQIPTNNNNNNNLWPNNNSPYSSNAGNTWNQNRNLNTNNNNNNNQYSNPNSPYYYNNGSQMIRSYFLLVLSFLAIIIFNN